MGGGGWGRGRRIVDSIGPTAIMKRLLSFDAEEVESLKQAARGSCVDVALERIKIQAGSFPEGKKEQLLSMTSEKNAHSGRGHQINEVMP